MSRRLLLLIMLLVIALIVIAMIIAAANNVSQMIDGLSAALSPVLSPALVSSAISQLRESVIAALGSLTAADLLLLLAGAAAYAWLRDSRALYASADYDAPGSSIVRDALIWLIMPGVGGAAVARLFAGESLLIVYAVQACGLLALAAVGELLRIGVYNRRALERSPSEILPTPTVILPLMGALALLICLFLLFVGRLDVVTFVLVSLPGWIGLLLTSLYAWRERRAVEAGQRDSFAEWAYADTRIHPSGWIGAAALTVHCLSYNGVYVIGALMLPTLLLWLAMRAHSRRRTAYLDEYAALILGLRGQISAGASLLTAFENLAQTAPPLSRALCQRVIRRTLYAQLFPDALREEFGFLHEYRLLADTIVLHQRASSNLMAALPPELDHLLATFRLRTPKPIPLAFLATRPHIAMLPVAFIAAAYNPTLSSWNIVIAAALYLFGALVGCLSATASETRLAQTSYCHSGVSLWLDELAIYGLIAACLSGAALLLPDNPALALMVLAFAALLAVRLVTRAVSMTLLQTSAPVSDLFRAAHLLRLCLGTVVGAAAVGRLSSEGLRLPETGVALLIGAALLVVGIGIGAAFWAAGSRVYGERGAKFASLSAVALILFLLMFLAVARAAQGVWLTAGALALLAVAAIWMRGRWVRLWVGMIWALISLGAAAVFAPLLAASASTQVWVSGTAVGAALIIEAASWLALQGWLMRFSSATTQLEARRVQRLIRLNVYAALMLGALSVLALSSRSDSGIAELLLPVLLLDALAFIALLIGTASSAWYTPRFLDQDVSETVSLVAGIVQSQGLERAIELVRQHRPASRAAHELGQVVDAIRAGTDSRQAMQDVDGQRTPSFRAFVRLMLEQRQQIISQSSLLRDFALSLLQPASDADVRSASQFAGGLAVFILIGVLPFLASVMIV